MAKKKPTMGHDPLAWMSEVETTSTSSATQNTETTEQSVEKDDISTQSSPAITQLPIESMTIVENSLKSNNSEETGHPIVTSHIAEVNSNPVEEVTESIDILPSSPGWITVDLESTLTLAVLPQLHTQLCQYQGKRVELVGDKVERVDTAALQLLFAFISSTDVTVSWKSTPSDEIVNAARLLGLSGQLSLSVVE